MSAAADGARAGPCARVRALLGARVDGASLAVFRIGFGVVMALESVSLLWPVGDTTKLGRFFLEPGFRFAYPGFAWVAPLPEPWMQVEVALLGVCALSLAAGRVPRAAAACVFAIWTHVWLLDAALYNNHHYLMSLLAFVLIWMPTGACFRLGAPRSAGDGSVAFWTVFLLRAQLLAMYFYAGVAKLTPEWLVHSEPLRTQLAGDATQDAIARALPAAAAAVALSEGFAAVLSRAGALLDLCVGFLLLVPRTRLLALVLLAGFHVANHTLLFDDIGWFPLLGLVSAPIFLDPDWPRRLWALLGARAIPRPDPGWLAAGALAMAAAAFAIAAPLGPSRLALAALALPAGLCLGWRIGGGRAARPGGVASVPASVFVCAWVAVQALLPLRHYAIPGDVAWTGEGGRFAWRMKSHARRPESIRIRIDDPLALGPDGRPSADAWPGPAFVLEEVDPFTLDWAARPEIVVVWGTYHGERIFWNPHAPAGAEGARGAEARWRAAFGRTPELRSTLDRDAVLAAVAGAVAASGAPAPERAAALERARENAAAIDAASAPGEALAAARSFRGALDVLASDPELGPAVRGVVARARPFTSVGGRREEAPFLEIRDPALFRVRADGFSRIDRSHWPADWQREGVVLSRPHASSATLHPALPRFFLLRAPGTRRLTWNPAAELSPRQQRKLATEPGLARAYAAHVADTWQSRTGRRPGVFVDVRAALLPWAAQPLVDPFVDLASVRSRVLRRSDWILDLDRRLGPGREGGPVPTRTPASAPAARPCAPVGRPAFFVDEGRFCVIAQAAQGPSDPALAVRVTPHPPWKLAPEFPSRVELESRFGRGSPSAGAARNTERELAFAVPLLEAGVGPVRGRVVFGVCRSAELCQRVSQPFAVDLAVR